MLRVPREALRSDSSPPGESSDHVRARVIEARARQCQRRGVMNAAMRNRDVDATFKLTAQDHALLDQAMAKFRLSARAYHRILKVARTIADLGDSDPIRTPHLSEAISYRTLDRLLNNE